MNVQFMIQVLCVSLCAIAPSFGASVPPAMYSPEVIPLAQDVQQEIARVVAAFSAGDMSEDAVHKIVQEFISFTNHSPQELLLQVLAIYGGKDEYRANPRSAMAKRLLLSALLQDMTSSIIVAAVAPKYEQTSDPMLQASLRMALGMVLFRDGRIDPDYEAFSTYIHQNNDRQPSRLVEYMYGHNSQAAIISILRACGDKANEQEIINELKGDPKAALPSLADRPEWWAHLYVVDMMERDPNLRTLELLNKLEKGTSPLVREKVS